jgi:hypothetical protein
MRNRFSYAIWPALAGLFIWCALAPAQAQQLGAGQVMGNPTASRRPPQAVGLSALFDRAFCSTANAALARISGSWVCLATMGTGNIARADSSTFTNGAFNGTVGATTPSTVAGTTGTFTGTNAANGLLNAANTTADVSGATYNILAQTTLSHAHTGIASGVIGQTTTSHATGTVASALGVSGDVEKTGVGNLTNAYGLAGIVNANNASGTITNAYGLFLGTPTRTGTVTNDYGVYQEYASAKNLFAGSTTFSGLAGLGSGCPTINNSGTLTGVTACSGGTSFPAGGVKGDLPYYSAANTGTATTASDANVVIQGGDPSGAGSSTAAAVLAYGYSKRIVLPPKPGFTTGTYKFSTNLTFPNGTELIIPCGVTLVPDGGVTVRNNGVTKGGQCVIAAGAGTVYLGRDVRSDWWPSTGGDDALAFTAADASLTDAASQSADGHESIIRLSCKNYTAKTNIVLNPTATNNMRMVGCGNTMSGITGAAAGSFSSGNVVVVQGSSTTNFKLRDFYIKSENSNQSVTCLGVGYYGTVTQGYAESEIDSLYITNCHTLVQVFSARQISWRNMALWAPAGGIPLVIDNPGGYFAGDMRWYGGQFVGNDDQPCIQLKTTHGGTFTGSISGTTLTVTAVAAGTTIQLQDYITGPGITANTRITALGSGVGGAGTYTVNNSQVVGSETITIPSTSISGIRFIAQDFYFCKPVISGTTSGTGLISDLWFTDAAFDNQTGDVADFEANATASPSVRNIQFGNVWANSSSVAGSLFKFNAISSREIKQISISNSRFMGMLGTTTQLILGTNVEQMNFSNNQMYLGVAATQLLNIFNSFNLVASGNNCIGSASTQFLTFSGTSDELTLFGNNLRYCVPTTLNNAAGATHVSGAANIPIYTAN